MYKNFIYSLLSMMLALCSRHPRIRQNCIETFTGVVPEAR